MQNAAQNLIDPPETKCPTCKKKRPWAGVYWKYCKDCNCSYRKPTANYDSEESTMYL